MKQDPLHHRARLETEVIFNTQNQYTFSAHLNDSSMFVIANIMKDYAKSMISKNSMIKDKKKRMTRRETGSIANTIYFMDMIIAEKGQTVYKELRAQETLDNAADTSKLIIVGKNSAIK